VQRRMRGERLGGTQEGAISAVLLLHHQSGPLRALRQALHTLAVRTREAQTCEEASRLLAESDPPELLFTDTQLPDGNWADVVCLAEKGSAPVNVIVVSRLVDVRLYIEALQAGAFDFIAPPFEPSELAHVVRCAAGNIASRRKTAARAAPSHNSAQMVLPAA